jgi:primosomal protein N' (replication factor Y)
MCSEGEVMLAGLPAHFKISSDTILLYNEEFGSDYSALSNNEYLIAEALEIRKQLHLREVQQLLDAHHVYPVIKKLIEKQVCIVWESLGQKYKPKTETCLVLHPDYATEEALAGLLNNWKRAPGQMELLLSYLHFSKTTGEVTQKALLEKSGAGPSALKGLIDKNILVQEKRQVDRIRQLPKYIETGFSLTTAQQLALNQVRKELQSRTVCLLHGVTGSGKTQIYVKIMEEYFNEQRQVLYLLPEIALTAQMIRRLQQHFGGHIAIYHSKFNNNERVELWKKIQSGEIKIVLGARSALFLPFRDLGLIIVDEEHDSSYKQQDPAPRYHARDTAIYYASLFGAHVLLGSATPSLESYYNARRGKYGLVELNERYGGLELPAIELVDTRQVVQKGRVMLSPQLREALSKTIAENRQAILFQNRRGYAPYLICGTCGHLPQCHDCDVTLTLHKYSNKLHCHYCGASYPRIVECPACGSVNWLEKNFGTEKIEEIIEQDFPAVKVARMDVDSIRGKSAHDNLLKLFEQHRIDVLIGTQMVVKGLDFDKVQLVGILDADGLLGFTDFRVNERAFQLMEQVSGRAGRKDAGGRVLIQGTRLQHPVILFLLQHDYKSFFVFELENRKQFNYPPYCRLLKITLRHPSKEIAQEAAEKLGNMLATLLPDRVMGPAAPYVNRVRNRYLMELQLKLSPGLPANSQEKQMIAAQFNLLHAEKRFSGVQLIADVDPV